MEGEMKEKKVRQKRKAERKLRRKSNEVLHHYPCLLITVPGYLIAGM